MQRSEGLTLIQIDSGFGPWVFGAGGPPWGPFLAKMCQRQPFRPRHGARTGLAAWVGRKRKSGKGLGAWVYLGMPGMGSTSSLLYRVTLRSVQSSEEQIHHSIKA
jgi:hypothetical protein